MYSLLFVLLAAVAAPANADLATVYSSCSQPNTIALTFDDGPYIFETNLAQELANAGIRATFFVNGNNWQCIYDQDMVNSVQTTKNLGHEFQSHTWHHKDLATLTFDQIHDEMWRTELALQRILGVTPALMRPPYGSYNDLVSTVASQRGQSLVLWDFDSGDSTGSTVAQSQSAYQDLANSVPPSILALNHEVFQGTVEQVVPFAINALQPLGYNFVPVSECLGVPAYQSVTAPQSPTSDWNCNI